MSRLALLSCTAALFALAACSEPQEPESPFPDEEDGAAQVFDGAPEDGDGEEFPAAYIYQCGGERVAIEFIDAERMKMNVGEDEFTMFRVVSASGAKFQSANDPDTVFWLQADSAMLTLQAEDYPECALTREPLGTDEAAAVDAGTPLARLASGEWIVVNLNGAAMLDGASATLRFTREGGLTGKASCNNYTTSFAIDGTSISLSPIAATRKMCPAEIMDQENAFLDTLGAVNVLEFSEDGVLILEGEAGTLMARQL